MLADSRPLLLLVSCALTTVALVFAVFHLRALESKPRGLTTVNRFLFCSFCLMVLVRAYETAAT